MVEIVFPPPLLGSVVFGGWWLLLGFCLVGGLALVGLGWGFAVGWFLGVVSARCVRWRLLVGFLVSPRFPSPPFSKVLSIYAEPSRI